MKDLNNRQLITKNNDIILLKYELDESVEFISVYLNGSYMDNATNLDDLNNIINYYME